MRRRSPFSPLLPFALVLAVLVGCSSDGSDGAAPTSTTTRSAGGDATTTTRSKTGEGAEQSSRIIVDAPKGTLTDADCWWDLGEIDPDVTVTCRTLTVPADWSKPEGDKIELPVARLHHKSVKAGTAPLVVLHGGPGGDTLASAPTGIAKGPIVAEQDVILWDQRGSGRSVPSLNCPERERAIIDSLSRTDPPDVELAANLDAARACRDRLVGEGIDLNDYSTYSSVNDLDALRAAMKAETWNVQGGSYGTRLGLAYARAHPDKVRALVIDSVYPPQVGSLARAKDAPKEALARLVEACADDAGCNAAFPDLGATIDKAAAALDADPGIVEKTVDVGGKPEKRTFELVGSDFRSGMHAALYQNAVIPLLPSVITAVANGDRSILPVYIDTAIPLLTGLSEGAYFSIDCADSGRLLDGADAEAVMGDGDYEAYALVLAQTYCDTWDVAPVPDAFNEVAKPDVPTLVFAGTLDPVTPATDSKAQAEAMPDARFVLAPRGGHGDAAFDDCTKQSLLGFLADPSSDLPACTASLKPTPFVGAEGG